MTEYPNIPQVCREHSVNLVKVDKFPDDIVAMENGYDYGHFAKEERIYEEHPIKFATSLCGRQSKNPGVDQSLPVPLYYFCDDCLGDLNDFMGDYFWDAQREEYYHPLKE